MKPIENQDLSIDLLILSIYLSVIDLTLSCVISDILTKKTCLEILAYIFIASELLLIPSFEEASHVLNFNS